MIPFIKTHHHVWGPDNHKYTSTLWISAGPSSSQPLTSVAARWEGVAHSEGKRRPVKLHTARGTHTVEQRGEETEPELSHFCTCEAAPRDSSTHEQPEGQDEELMDRVQ